MSDKWVADGVCSATCGVGVQTMTRGDPIVEAANGGLACGPKTKQVSCVGTDGACPVDCVLSNWTAWSTCTADCYTASQPKPTRTSSRTVLVHGSHGANFATQNRRSERKH